MKKTMYKCYQINGYYSRIFMNPHYGFGDIEPDEITVNLKKNCAKIVVLESGMRALEVSTKINGHVRSNVFEDFDLIEDNGKIYVDFYKGENGDKKKIILVADIMEAE